MQTILDDWNLSLTVDHVLRGQGMDPAVARARREKLVEAAEWALKESLPLFRPRVVVREYAVDGLRHKRLRLDGGSLEGPLIVQHLAGAKRVAVMVCTLGPDLEAVTSELMRSDAVLGMAMEGAGTAAVEMLSVLACNRLEAGAKAEELHASIPLSPGMVGWPVDPGQRQVFALVDASEIGVRLTASLMMSPRLSVSQVVGFGEEKMLEGRACDYCSLKDTCRYQDHFA